MQRVHLEEVTKLGQHILPADARAAGTYTSAAAADQLASGAYGYEDAMLVIDVGAATGSPTSFSLTVKLQDGATSTPATDVTNKSLEITAAGIYTIPFTPNGLKQYYRAHATLTFSGGSSPKLPFSVHEVRTGGSDKYSSV